MQRRRTSRRVLIVDRVAGVVVRAGGLLVIVAVLGILVFLVATAAPLFRDGVLSPRDGASAARTRVPVEGPVGVLAVDEYRMLAVAVGSRPEAVCFRPDTGEVVARVPVPELGEGAGAEVVAASRSVRAGEAVLAGASGRLAFLDLGFESDFVLGAEGESLRAAMRVGEVRVVSGSVVRRVAGGNLRRVVPKVAVRGSVALPADAGRVLAVGYATSGEAGAAVAVTSNRQVHVVREAVTTTLLGAVERAWTAAPPLEAAPRPPAPPQDPFAALVDEEVRTAWVLGRGGGFLRIDLTTDPPKARETGLLLDDPATSSLSAAAFVLGDRSLVACDDRGGASVWSLVPIPGAASGDGRETRRLHSFPGFPSPVVALATGSTRRTLYLGHADGAVTAAYVTNERILARVGAFAGPVVALAAPSKDDGLLVVGPDSEARSFDFDCPHPEASLSALFGKVHYEGYLEPSYIYQSTSGTDEAETKLSLVPLLFGTLKGTFYALLFALPLALLAALYTSQFMHPRVRALVKPSIEVMASLPSVVLGFLAALVIAPFVVGVLPGILLAVVALPVVGSVAGVLWHAAPLGLRRRIGSGARLAIALALVAGTVTLAWRSNGAIQRALFSGPANPSGDFPTWCRAAPGSGSGVPLLALGLFLLGACVGPLVVPRFLRLDPPRSGRDRLGVLGRGLVKAVLFAVVPGIVLAALAGPLEAEVFGGDFRRFLLGPDGEVVEQLNCLVLGIAMGFAVIPIVYTITEDALSSIPESLRSASLACGASPWQTALRVVAPAAAPGIFSAVMIGLGRAVGETMIVLMATGGTAIMDVSPFNGFRSLSANIATEMPEAPQGGTLYRVLFLAGLLLFALTFVVNTLAEVVRIRFRRRFKGL